MYTSSWTAGRESMCLTAFREDNSSIPYPKIRFIYELQYHPLFETSWVYGGEYEDFARIVTLVVKMWVIVGLQVHFVFDGRSLAGVAGLRTDDSQDPTLALSSAL
jgi:hypothetical protein